MCQPNLAIYLDEGKTLNQERERKREERKDKIRTKETRTAVDLAGGG